MWWKYLSIVILLYVFVGGFVVPLRPGIMNTQPERLVAGASHTLVVDMYNTRYDMGDKVNVLVRVDGAGYIKATSVAVRDQNSLEVAMTVPRNLPTSSGAVAGTLIVHDSDNGFAVSPSAVTIVRGDSPAVEAVDWSDSAGLEEGPWKLQFPFIGILYETIRNTFFHVAIWFAMFFLMAVSMAYSIAYLRQSDLHYDAVASSFAYVAIVFGIMGMITGAIWAKNTWGVYWTNDPKLNMAAVALIIYVAYAILRSAVTDPDQRARVTAAYNIFAVVAFVPLVFIIPRLTSSLHPGNGGNPALGGEDLDNTLRLFFYPAIIGLIMAGSWLALLMVRLEAIKMRLLDFKIDYK